MLQILHLTDLHLFLKNGLHREVLNLLSHLKNLPGAGFLDHIYGYSYEPAERELANALSTACGHSDPTILALTGDIAALPYDSPQDIDRVYYPYVTSLIPLRNRVVQMLALLGNHDWQMNGSTNFKGSLFDGSALDVLTHPRVAVATTANLTVVFFLVSSTNSILPATGTVTGIPRLQQLFISGRNGQLQKPDGTTLSSNEYKQAVKVALLHHFPLPRAAYGGNLSFTAYQLLKLYNRDDLTTACLGEVDMFLFGHSHVPMRRTWKRMVMVDCGSTLVTETGTAPPNGQFQLIRIHGPDDIEVIPHRWRTSHSTFVREIGRSFRRSTTGEWF